MCWDAGDRVRVTVFDQAGLTNTYAVDQSGYMSFPLVGSVVARGRTAKQLEADIAAQLRNGYLRSPDVSVEIDRYRPIFVLGEVGAAGQYSYVPGMTVQKAIAASGGYTARAQQADVDITRSVNGKCDDRSGTDFRPAAAGRHGLRSRTAVLIPMAGTGSPMRIVHCFRSPVGGIFRHVRDLVDAQSSAGHLVGIVCDSSTGGDFEDRLFDTIKPKLALGLQRIPMSRHIGFGDTLAAWRTYQAIKKLNPDILHGHGAKGGAYARAFGSLLRVFRSRVARFYSLHGGSLHYSNTVLSGKVFFLLERLLGTMTDELLFVAEFERKVYEAKIGKPGAATVVYNGLRPDEFVDVSLVENPADFLYIGMMRDLKGPDLFIEAIKIASSISRRPLTAVMVGAGDDLPKYKHMVETKGLSSRITFHDPMPAREAFRLAKTVVVPSRAEAMPYIVLEALGAGKTLIATRVGGIPEILGENSPALCVPNANSIGEKMGGHRA